MEAEAWRGAGMEDTGMECGSGNVDDKGAPLAELAPVSAVAKYNTVHDRHATSQRYPEQGMRRGEREGRGRRMNEFDERPL